MSELIKEIKRDDSMDYLGILRGVKELPFQVGKNLLMDFLRGDYSNKSISKNRLDELSMFGELKIDKTKLSQEIDKLIANGFVEFTISDYNKFIKVLQITTKGKKEISNPTMADKTLANKVGFKRSEVTSEDLEKFKVLDSFLGRFNNDQKKAIISPASKILCVAGAGSGKTTVLTKRIEFLVKYKSVDASKILAITFTRKARQEMQKRLLELNVQVVQVHTFNSFCETILKKHERRIYGRPTRVQSYVDKIFAMNMALASLGLDMDDAVDGYFSKSQKKFKNSNQLSNSFMNDCFSVMDYFKLTGKKEYDFSKDVDADNKTNAERIYKINKYLKEHMEIQGLRDYTDQLIDAIKFLKEFPSEIPKFEHVLVDEYQDVNAMQIELLKLFNAPNFFAVGDPRQAIFGWRGSDINYILNFEKDYGDSEIIHLTKNYRSTKEIVDFTNLSIEQMGLPSLEHHYKFEKAKINILDFEHEEAERDFVIREIVTSGLEPKEIFVLARTNRQLMELSQVLKIRGINHVVKTEEIINFTETPEGAITLATIHAIKGLEAKRVFVIGANDQNFPCKATDHPAIEMIKKEDYNREEEERRLFYVALSRAKESLYITYTGKKPTYFISDKMKTMCL
jgi:superfamily I DNA/RNA helicase